jgi:hypothetical protein
LDLCHVSRRHSVTGAVNQADTHTLGVVPLSSALGERYLRLTARRDKLGSALEAAAGLVDRTAARAAHLLRQYPWVRLGALCYVLLVHLYVYALTVMLQRRAAALVAGDGEAAAALRMAERTTHGVGGGLASR